MGVSIICKRRGGSRVALAAAAVILAGTLFRTTNAGSDVGTCDGPRRSLWFSTEPSFTVVSHSADQTYVGQVNGAWASSAMLFRLRKLPRGYFPFIFSLIQQFIWLFVARNVGFFLSLIYLAWQPPLAFRLSFPSPPSDPPMQCRPP